MSHFLNGPYNRVSLKVPVRGHVTYLKKGGAYTIFHNHTIVQREVSKKKRPFYSPPGTQVSEKLKKHPICFEDFLAEFNLNSLNKTL